MYIQLLSLVSLVVDITISRFSSLNLILCDTLIDNLTIKDTAIVHAITVDSVSQSRLALLLNDIHSIHLEFSQPPTVQTDLC